jgi:hypothetical protein
LRGKLDCGADSTVIPEQLVSQLGLTARSHLWARSFDGTYSWREVFYISLGIEGFRLPSVRCVAADRATLLVGRNVLNRFIVTLNGKNLTFDLQDS